MALVVAFILLPLVALLALTFTTLGVQSPDVTRSKADARIAFYVSEAGADEAIQLLQSNPGYAGSFYSRRTGGLSTAWVVVTNNLRGDHPRAADGTQVPAGHALVFSSARIFSQRNAPRSNPNVGVTGETVRLVPLTGAQRFHWRNVTPAGR